jgi:hypothetical protein
MTPLTPEERKTIIESHPSAEPGEIDADIEEYESLVAEMFAHDPAQAPSPAPFAAAGRPTVDRLAQLQQKLFKD